MTHFQSLLTLIALSSSLAWAQPGFTARDARGTYTFFFEGTLVRTTTGQPIPVVAIGTVILDGNGKVAGSRYLNLGGQTVRETASGTYTVTPDGFGTINIIAVPNEGEPPVVPPTQEVFHFILTNRNGGFGLGVSIKAGNGQDIGLVSIVRATFTRQEIP